MQLLLFVWYLRSAWGKKELKNNLSDNIQNNVSFLLRSGYNFETGMIAYILNLLNWVSMEVDHMFQGQC